MTSWQAIPAGAGVLDEFVEDENHLWRIYRPRPSQPFADVIPLQDAWRHERGRGCLCWPSMDEGITHEHLTEYPVFLQHHPLTQGKGVNIDPGV